MILIGIIVVFFFLLIAFLSFVMGFQEGISEGADEEGILDYWAEIVLGIRSIFYPKLENVGHPNIYKYLFACLWMMYNSMFIAWSNLFSLLGYSLGYKVFKK